ncbi:hypothetical protein EJF36_17265 [Bacillus sp. HMF5848]|uniref:IucA/IucC family C-terminal-domain containing protein n=1 Tax=Bacillus sp. HMF5848 TaxID=2495421 RepID=UPI000F776D8C|nr:IucA/IucC family C-terminal-domain containing protein [Bacillus sp. HMF5848]RSK29432.1 hypothetical protein EJF36_17265 [Bacillus sp. HMF5848]
MFLTDKELQTLAGYRLTTEVNSLSRSALSLLDNETLFQYLSSLKQNTRSANMMVAASLFSKRYSFLAVIGLASMSLYRKSLNLSTDNVYLVEHTRDNMWIPSFQLKQMKGKVLHDEERKHMLTALFREHMTPMWQQLHATTNLRLYTLWENVAVYIFWLYDDLLQQPFPDEIKDRLRDDFSFILSDDQAECFGKYSKNPLARYYTEKKLVPQYDQYVRVRKTCCLSYLSDDKGRQCITCPITCTRKDES